MAATLAAADVLSMENQFLHFLSAVTEIGFTENAAPKKRFMKPFVKSYLKKQRTYKIQSR